MLTNLLGPYDQARGVMGTAQPEIGLEAPQRGLCIGGNPKSSVENHEAESLTAPPAPLSA